MLCALKKWDPLLGSLQADSWGSVLSGCISESPAPGLLFAHFRRQADTIAKQSHTRLDLHFN